VTPGWIFYSNVARARASLLERRALHMNIYVALSQIIVILSLSSHRPGSFCDVHVPGPQFDMSPLELIKEYCVWFFICCHTSTYPKLTLTITPISVFPSLYHSSLAQRLLIASHILPFWQGRIELIHARYYEKNKFSDCTIACCNHAAHFAHH
jgi:hypothetical protein